MQLPQSRRISASQQGGYACRLRGRGVDFVENRVYQPGDDLRTMNWLVTARTGKPHTKLYQQERERPVYVLLDFNESMFFGTRVAFKSVVAAKAAALIAWTASLNEDRVGALFLGEKIKWRNPLQNKHHLVELLQGIVQSCEKKESQSTNLSLALEELRRHAKTGSLIYIFSDFYNLNDAAECELTRLSKRHEVINVCIYDLLEKEAPPHGQYLFYDTQNQKSISVNTASNTTCEAYKSIFEKRVMTLKKACFANNMKMIELGTHEDIKIILQPHLLRKR